MNPNVETLAIKPVVIRDHYDVIRVFMRQLHKHEQMLFSKTADWDDIEKNYVHHIIKMQEECDGTFLMAYKNGHPIGFIFGYVEEPDDSRIEKYTGLELYVSDGYVLPEYRQQAVYKQLNQVLEKIYIEKGVKRITRFTLQNNNAMHQFLVASGYIATRILYEKWLE